MWLYTNDSLDTVLGAFHVEIPLTEHPPYEKKQLDQALKTELLLFTLLQPWSCTCATLSFWNRNVNLLDSGSRTEEEKGQMPLPWGRWFSPGISQKHKMWCWQLGWSWSLWAVVAVLTPSHHHCYQCRSTNKRSNELYYMHFSWQDIWNSSSRKIKTSSGQHFRKKPIQKSM